MHTKRIFEEHLALMKDILQNKMLIEKINEIIQIIITCYKNNNKVIFFGCGGSAADSQHLAAEFINKFNFERRCLPAIALTTDTSVITAISNDYDFEKVFSRQVEGLVHEHDVVIGISTSGRSRSVIRGLQAAKNNNAITIAMTGNYIHDVEHVADHIISIPSTSTPRIQEAHITIGHILCQGVEQYFLTGTEL